MKHWMEELVLENIKHNRSQDYSHIKDPYLKEKLDSGLIKYDPESWIDGQLSPFEERELDR